MLVSQTQLKPTLRDSHGLRLVPHSPAASIPRNAEVHVCVLSVLKRYGKTASTPTATNGAQTISSSTKAMPLLPFHPAFRRASTCSVLSLFVRYFPYPMQVAELILSNAALSNANSYPGAQFFVSMVSTSTMDLYLTWY